MVIIKWGTYQQMVFVLCYHSVVSDFLWPHGLQPARFLCPWGSSRQEYWSGLPCPPPGNLPNSRIKPRSPSLQAEITFELILFPKYFHIHWWFLPDYPLIFIDYLYQSWLFIASMTLSKAQVSRFSIPFRLYASVSKQMHYEATKKRQPCASTANSVQTNPEQLTLPYVFINEH